MITFLENMTRIVVTGCQMLAVFVICIGVIRCMIVYVRDALIGTGAHQAIQDSRMELGQAFSLGLGLLIGSSILNTAIAPSWNEIGQLAAIIAIRTTLNYFLLRDLSIQADTKNAIETIKRWPFGRRRTDQPSDLSVCDCEKQAQPVDRDDSSFADTSPETAEQKTDEPAVVI